MIDIGWLDKRDETVKEQLLLTLGAALLGGPWGAPLRAAERPPLAKCPLKPEQAKEIQQRWATHLGKEGARTNSIGMRMVLIPPGEFTMGRTEEQFDKILAHFKNDEKLRKNYLGMATWSMLLMPAHQVRITKPFYMGACEVTVAQVGQALAQLLGPGVVGILHIVPRARDADGDVRA